MARSDLLTAEDPLYRELYDVRREGELLGNLVEQDMNPVLNAVRDRGGVQQGFLRELLGLPTYHRHPLVEGKPGYTALSFEACETAFRDGERFSSAIVHQPNPRNEETLGLLEMDGKRHRAHRRTMQPKFIEPQAVTWWRENWIEESVERLIDRLKQLDRVDLVQDFCARIPVHAITRAIGMEGNDALEFRYAMFRSNGSGCKTIEEQQEAAGKVERMLLEVISSRRVAPVDDLTSFMITSPLKLPDETERTLTDREAMNLLRLVMIAGGGTTSRQMATLFWALLTHRDQLGDLRQDRLLLKQAVDESLRWNATAPLFNRLVVEDTELCGVPLPAGAVLEVCLGAANRDPQRWENPDAFDIHRPVKGHLGFGLGQHRCLGLNVAHCEMALGLSALLDAFPDMRLDPDAPEPYMTGGFEARSVSALPVLLR